MRKWIISLVPLMLLSIWAVKYYSLNHGFKVRYQNERKDYKTHEKVTFDDSVNVLGNIHEGYSISLENAYVIEKEKLLADLNKQSSESETAERCIVLDFSIYNDESDNDFNLAGLYIMGIDWFSPFSYKTTEYLNESYFDNFSPSGRISIPKGENISISVAYDIYQTNFSPKAWNALEEQDAWAWLTCSPLDQRIKINFENA